MDFGPKTVKSVAVISGGAAKDIEEAGQLGMDVFVSGEPALAAYSAAQEYGINGVFAGHYATETHGVKQIAKLLKQKFKLPSTFIDLKISF
jgi:putative NIF3 family GTP cyclohydrolase 1 type 2